MVSLTGVFAMAASQEAYITIGGVVDFSVSPTLTFGPLIPGGTDSDISTITLNPANTENLEMDIYLNDSSDQLFTNIALTTEDTTIGGLGLGPNLGIGVGAAIPITLEDTDGEGEETTQDKDITATLTVPGGTLPGDRMATIMYIVTSPAPA